MQANKQSGHIHPLMAGAAASVILVSLVAAAAIVGIIPNSHSTAVDTEHAAPQAVMTAPAPAPVQQAAAAPVVKEVVEHKTVVHHQYVQHRARPVQVAQAAPAPQYAPAPAYQQPAPAAQNSPVGIGVGAVVGGLIGSQVGGGNGKTLATIAGAVGGGYLGNEIAKKSQ
ncbi:MAG: glycine zipper 2TM domain-containing protein [Bacillota bacterium]